MLRVVVTMLKIIVNRIDVENYAVTVLFNDAEYKSIIKMFKNFIKLTNSGIFRHTTEHRLENSMEFDGRMKLLDPSYDVYHT